MPATIVPAVPVGAPLTQSALDDINAYLNRLPPDAILAWAVGHLPSLYQTTAFGLTGLVAIDMLSKLTSKPPPLIFLDTLYHFTETLDLVEDIKRRYNIPVIVYKPDGCSSASEFEAKYGERLWELSDDTYDWLVKVEPARRAYTDLDVKSVITGRRASQGAQRAQLSPLEVDGTGLLKLNPFFSWSFSQVRAYIEEHNVPHNALLAQGYKSVGDWHSTAKSGEGDDGERAGRWAGKQKTECGLHEDYHTKKLKGTSTTRIVAVKG